MAGTETFKGSVRTLISTATTTQVKTGRGRLARVVISGGTMGGIDIYDDTDGTSDPIWGIASPTKGDIYEIDCPIETGIRVVTASATQVTVIWS